MASAELEISAWLGGDWAGVTANAVSGRDGENAAISLVLIFA